ncbi:MAG: C1 family peptidase [Bacteroidales bacterium]|nr:C1 family peptidase [Bacteroidales bacterium]
MRFIKAFCFCLAFLVLNSFLFGQESIDDNMIKQFKEGVKDNAETRALRNAITNNDIKKLALNRLNIDKVNHYFSNKVTTKGITNQKSSGRCWLFTGLNTIKPYVLEKYNINEFDFSQNYSFFWDQLEKSNLFLEGIIETRDKDLQDRKVEWLLKNPVGDGGQWTTFTDIIQKYGLIPKTAMPETNNSENTRWMSRLINRKLREDAMMISDMHKDGKDVNAIRTAKVKMLSEIYRMLSLTLGEPPVEFTWQYKDKDGEITKPKTYTPMSFYKEAIGVDLDNYIMFMNDPSREYYKLYEIDLDRSVYDGKNWKYINLPINEIKEFTKLSILDNEAMYFSCDVGKQLNTEEGTLDVNNYDYGDLFGTTFGMDKKQRIQTFESGSSHGMALIGFNQDESGMTDKWLLENSWGADKGYKGYLTMTDKWFDEYMFRIVIKKEYVAEKILKILEQDPIMLPPWDPMFAQEE